MSLRVCVLASGSAGNCTLVASATTRILIDAGLSGRETLRRLEAIGVDPSTLSAVCLTHEHADHRTGLSVLHRRLKVPLYANAGTVEGVERDNKLAGLTWNVFTTGSPFEIGDLRIDPFSVAHDSYDPVGFVMSHGSACVGVVSDIGVVTGLVRERLRRCGLIVIEANHDEEVLKASARPWALKQRILGRQGHLSNRQAAELVAEIAGNGLRVVFLAHLSAECNAPHLAERTMRDLLVQSGCADIDIRVTYPDRPTEMVAVG